MSIELKVPEVGESITEVEIGDWLKRQGETVVKDEPVATLESEKATVELPAPAPGRIGKILKQKGETAKVGEVIAFLEEGGGEKSEARSAKSEVPAPSAQPPKPPPAVSPKPTPAPEAGHPPIHPVSQAVTETRGPEPSEPVAPPADSARQEEVVPMSRLRRTVAERLVEAQHTAALLTTFNEIDMSAVVALRKEYGEVFQQKHNVKLGFMSFFVKAAIEALKQFPPLNAEIRGTSIAYHNFYDIGIAVASGKGLVVPVLRNAERMSFAQIEQAIGDFGRRAKENKLKVEELQGGTFTISNGGVFGSLLSTPIINPPQTGVLGLHAIQERPVAHQGVVIIRPMMYVALTYDHRLVDGREAVLFLRRIKEILEVPARMLLEA